MKQALLVFIIYVVFIGGIAILDKKYPLQTLEAALPSDYKNLTFFIGDETVTLTHGVSRVPIMEGGASMITTQYFGNEVRTDLDSDGDEDIVFLVTQNGGGSGTFFYVVAALKEEEGYRGSHAVLIGDRIAPQTTEYRDGLVIVNYADRAPGDAFAVMPYIGTSRYLKFTPEDGTFGEVVKDFEGESTPENMIKNPDEVQIRLGERISTLGVSITPTELLEDSRCPEGAQCIWEGTVRVRATLESGLGSGNQEFRLREPITTEAETVTLLDVQPPAVLGEAIQEGDYIFVFRVRRN